MGSSYSDKLRDPRWQKKRLEIMQRDDWKCRMCGDSKSTLHVHHTVYSRRKAPWNVPDDTLVTLCERCHELAHVRGVSIWLKNEDGVIFALPCVAVQEYGNGFEKVFFDVPGCHGGDDWSCVGQSGESFCIGYAGVTNTGPSRRIICTAIIPEVPQ
jgi:hypothetical protein